jgi:hypothetical protein
VLVVQVAHSDEEKKTHGATGDPRLRWQDRRWCSNAFESGATTNTADRKSMPVIFCQAPAVFQGPPAGAARAEDCPTPLCRAAAALKFAKDNRQIVCRHFVDLGRPEVMRLRKASSFFQIAHAPLRVLRLKLPVKCGARYVGRAVTTVTNSVPHVTPL